MYINPIIFVLGILLTGALFLLAGWFVKDRIDKLRKASAEEQAQRILDDAQKTVANLRAEKLNEIRNEHLKLKTQLENDFEKKRADINNRERQVREQEKAHCQRIDDHERNLKELKKSQQALDTEYQKLEQHKNGLNTEREKISQQLEEVAKMTREDALRKLREEIIDRAKQDAAEMVKDIRDKARHQANREAREIIVQAIQRSAADHSAETTVSVVNIPNDEVKGRIIGREGRNIRAFESATGVEVIIDDTPEAVTLSAFDPFRREVARLSLENLISDGRIHPARIEEVVKKAETELEERIVQLGDQAAMSAGVDGIHPELLKNLGKLHYRTSYGQNVLKHSVEVARLSALMAVELGLDSKLAARAGLLHDIGKAIDRNAEGTHTELGAELARRYRESKVVLNSIASHHDDHEPTSLIACLVQAADAISGARPGARRDSLEGYIKRLEKLEELANTFSGVSKTFALQAGREIRVIVENDKVSDAHAEQMAHDIAERVQEELEYPGQIKVTVIREFRAIEFAK